MALIALRVGGEKLGLLQFNDKRKGQFSPETISVWERLADYLAVAVAKAQADESLQEAHENLQMKSEELQTQSEEIQEQNEELQAQSEELRESYKALLESEAKYRDLFNTVQEIFYIDRFIYDEKGNVVDWIFEDINPAGVKLLGFKDVDEAKGKRGSEILGHEIASFYLAMIEKARKSRDTVTFQYHSPYVDKEFLTSYSVRGDRLISSQMDITEHKRIEDLQRENEMHRKVAEAIEAERRRLFDILETLPAMICLLTSDYHIAFANRSYREHFGVSSGLHCYEARFGFINQCEFCESYKVLETGKPHHWESNGPDGRVIDAYDP